MRVGQTLSGLQYLLAGFSLITEPGLRRYVLAPLIINFLFFIGLFFALIHFVDEFNRWFINHVPSWLQWLSGIVWLLFLAAFILVFIYAFVVMANVVAAPFNSVLSEKVELFLTGKLPPQKSILDNIKGLPHVLWRQLMMMAYFVPRAVVLLLLFFIPVINAFSMVAWFLFSAWYMAMQYVDYPTDNHQISFRDVRRFLGQRKGSALSLGSCILVGMMIPGVNLVIMPAAVAAATKFWIDENK
jgi:CysZ protein